MDEFEDEAVEDTRPGPAVTRQLFEKWRAARRGTVHAEKMNNPVWEWLIRTRISAYTGTTHFEGTGRNHSEPGWCFARYGQTRTILPDGRTLLVAGEHEDFYDPDFFIYNDVVVQHPDGSLDIHGYPESEFPPTDFHSATLVGDKLILVGNVGYPHDRIPGKTQVLSLDVHSLRIELLKTTGDCPSWISKHSAKLSDDGIVLRGGQLWTVRIDENIDDWMLDTATWAWTRLTDRQWPRWSFMRKDREPNNLWDLRTAKWESMMGRASELGKPLTSPELIETLYRPAIAHELVASDTEGTDKFNVYRVRIDGVVVRYVEDMYDVTLTVEGRLPQGILDMLVSDLRDKLTRLEQTEYVAERL